MVSYRGYVPSFRSTRYLSNSPEKQHQAIYECQGTWSYLARLKSTIIPIAEDTSPASSAGPAPLTPPHTPHKVNFDQSPATPGLTPLKEIIARLVQASCVNLRAKLPRMAKVFLAMLIVAAKYFNDFSPTPPPPP
ncbi:hypothetical protein BC826DRAFT_1064231 [Russula brevipes]|nr:hypothetical protein BC826DRAFT_1064231 [Russula brevipes]